MKASLIFMLAFVLVAALADFVDPALAQHGGIAAILSRAEPWEPAMVETANTAASSTSTT